MNKYLKSALLSCLHMLLELVMIFPVLYLISHLLMGATLMRTLFLIEITVIALLGVITRVFIPVAWVQMAVGIPISIGMIILVGKTCGGVWPNAYVLPVILSPFVFYRGKQHAQNTWDSVLPNFVLFAVLVVQFIIIAFVRLNKGLDEHMSVMYVSIPIAYITAFIVLNRINLVNLIDEAQARSKSSSLAISGGMDKQNRFLLIILLIIGVAISLGTVLYNIAQWALDKFVLLLKLFYKLLFDFDMNAPTSAPNNIPAEEQQTGFFEFEAGDMTFWEPFFNVLSYIGIAIVFVGLVILLYKFVKQLIRIISGVFAKFSEQGGGGLETGPLFEDSREYLVDLSQLPKMYADSAKERLSSLFKREPGYDDMPNAVEKLKYLFRKSLKKAQQNGYQHRSSYTAREAVSEASRAYPGISGGAQKLADEYDEMRYAGREPDINDVDELRKTLGNL